MLQAVDGGGHDWPMSPTLDATSRALVFFEEHPLPETRSIDSGSRTFLPRFARQVETVRRDG